MELRQYEAEYFLEDNESLEEVFEEVEKKVLHWPPLLVPVGKKTVSRYKPRPQYEDEFNVERSWDPGFYGIIPLPWDQVYRE